MKTKPGDTIEITKGKEFKDKRFIVVDRPIGMDNIAYRDCPWVENRGQIVSVVEGTYEIVRIVKQPNTGTDTDKFLKHQLNANLASVFR